MIIAIATPVWSLAPVHRWQEFPAMPGYGVSVRVLPMAALPRSSPIARLPAPPRTTGTRGSHQPGADASRAREDVRFMAFCRAGHAYQAAFITGLPPRPWIKACTLLCTRRECRPFAFPLGTGVLRRLQPLSRRVRCARTSARLSQGSSRDPLCPSGCFRTEMKCGQPRQTSAHLVGAVEVKRLVSARNSSPHRK